MIQFVRRHRNMYYLCEPATVTVTLISISLTQLKGCSSCGSFSNRVFARSDRSEAVGTARQFGLWENSTLQSDFRRDELQRSKRHPNIHRYSYTTHGLSSISYIHAGLVFHLCPHREYFPPKTPSLKYRLMHYTRKAVTFVFHPPEKRQLIPRYRSP